MAITALLSTRLALPFRNPNYGIYAAGDAVSLIGTWMQRISVGWLGWELSHSGLWLGIIAFADSFPVMLVGAIAGAAADRWDRLQVVQISQVVSLLQATILFALAALDRMNIGLLVGLTAWRAVDRQSRGRHGVGLSRLALADRHRSDDCARGVRLGLAHSCANRNCAAPCGLALPRLVRARQIRARSCVTMRREGSAGEERCDRGLTRGTKGRRGDAGGGPRRTKRPAQPRPLACPLLGRGTS